MKPCVVLFCAAILSLSLLEVSSRKKRCEGTDNPNNETNVDLICYGGMEDFCFLNTAHEIQFIIDWPWETPADEEIKKVYFQSNLTTDSGVNSIDTCEATTTTFDSSEPVEGPLPKNTTVKSTCIMTVSKEIPTKDTGIIIIEQKSDSEDGKIIGCFIEECQTMSEEDI